MTASFLAAWMVQGLVIAALFAGTAALLQRIAREAVPTRAIWGAALVGATLLIFIAPFRLEEAARRDGLSRIEGVPLSAAGFTQDFDPVVAVGLVAERARAALDAPMLLAADAVRLLPDSVARVVTGAWAVIALALVTLLVASHRRLRRSLAAAEARDIDGVAVRLTEDLGPAVVGVRDPMVVVPRWLLALPSAEQALVVRHERSHVAAGDPLLLMTGVALAALQPWNPVTWFVVSRLRLAIELDCDRRLLRTGTSPRAYGDTLIALASAASPARRPALLHPMFTHHHSHLAQRIIAMTERPVRLIPARRAAVAALAAAALVAACESKLPTDAEVRDMDAETAVRSVAGVAAIDPENVTYIVDGKRVSPLIAKGIAADRITGVSVLNGRSEIYITTDDSLRGVSLAKQTMPERVVEGHPLAAPSVLMRDSSNRVQVIMPDRSESKEKFTGIIMIDGVRATMDQFGRISPDRIESVSVVKGAAAVRSYGADAENGVILVKTKPRR